MSQGPGRCQRRIIALLEGAPERRLSRTALDGVLVAGEGYYPSNVLRAIRGLAREHLVTFADRRRKEDSIVVLPREVEPMPEAKVMELLSEIGGQS